MSEQIHLTYADLLDRARRLVGPLPHGTRAYGIPRGGVHALHLALAARPDLTPVEDPARAAVLLDDIIDSGATAARYRQRYGVRTLALVDKQGADRDWLGRWVTFPWERAGGEAAGPEENVRRLLEYVGEDPSREGLRETPARVLKAYREMFSGYKTDVAGLFKVFEDGACDELVLLRDVSFTSVCEHHLLPFTGRAHVAYVPDGRVIGLSKLARIVDAYARRAQVQERLTVQVTKALDEHLRPKGSACVVQAHHACMSCRGVGKPGSTMVTSSLTGVFRENPAARSEFLSLLRVR